MSRVYQLKITLKGSKPPIWRRFTVDSKITLGGLHHVIQDVMGWMGGHLHEYVSVYGNRYGTVDMDGMDDYCEDVINENKTRLCDVLKQEKQKLLYCYDFGDDWEHQLILEKKLEVPEKHPAPRCLKGKNACPPEDCGGIYGYYELLTILEDPTHPQYEEMREWIGRDIDPHEFDMDYINEILK